MKNTESTDTGRRRFLQTGVTVGLGLPFFGSCVLASSEQGSGPLFTQMGINASLAKAPEVAAEGADFLLIGVNRFLVPNKPEAEFEKQLRLLEKSPIPVYSCNSFLRGDALRSIGPDAKLDNVLSFAKIAFQRAKRAGVKRIIFGSSGSRRLPEGWSKAQGDEEFIALLHKMAELAEPEGIIVAVENLQERECNYLTRLHEVGEIVAAVNHPNIRMLADLYHASVMQDPASDLEKYAHLVDTVEIAEAKGRTVPGVNGQDFGPYFQALRAGGFQGPIEIEGKWKIDQVAKAFATIREQSS